MYQPRHHNPKIRNPSAAAQFPARAFVACEDFIPILRDPPAIGRRISIEPSTSQNRPTITSEFAVTRPDPKKRLAENKTDELPVPVFGRCCFYEPFVRKTTPKCRVTNPTTREHEGKINPRSLHFAASGEGDTGVGGNGPSLLASESSSKSSEGATQETTGKPLPEENENPMKSMELTRGMSSSL